MSLSPVPEVDGGTLLKWTLLARGKSEQEADTLVHRVDRGMAILGGILGAPLLAAVAVRRRIPATSPIYGKLQVAHRANSIIRAREAGLGRDDG